MAGWPLVINHFAETEKVTGVNKAGSIKEDGEVEKEIT